MMLVFEPGAAQDIRDAVGWYLHEAGPARAQAFDSDLHRNFDLILQMPALGKTIHVACRSWPLRRHPYAIIYRIEPNAIRVIAIAHQNRRPAYWAGKR